MTPNDRRAVLLVVVAIALVWLLARVSAADSRQVPEWTVPPSAITATWSPPEQTPVPTVIGLPRGIGAEADHEAPTASAALATARPGSPHSLAELVRTGTASFYDAGPGLYAALPGPWRAGRWVRVCGPARCAQAPVVTSCQCGSHVIDLSPQLWEAVSGMNTVERWRYGVTSVSIIIEGGKPS